MRFVTIDGQAIAQELNLAPVTFHGSGYYRVDTNGIDITEAMFNFQVAEVVVLRRVAGTGGQTKIDVKVGGVSMFTSGNEPVVLASAGDNARVTKVPDIPAITQGAKLQMDILEAEDGFPEDLTVILKG